MAPPMTSHLTKPIRAIHFMVLAFLMTIGTQATPDIDDGASLKGQHIYVCDGENFTIVDTETGWGLLNEPDFEVFTTYDGFMLIDQKSGA